MEGNQGRLSMLDAHGHRKFIIPAEVQGFYAILKKRVHWILLSIFVLTPWIQIQGEQAILLDLPNRHFVFFGLHLFAHDAPLTFFLVLGFVSGLALVTALWGRVWCGWACPQTVFIERVYRQIEIWVEGSYIQRRKLQSEGDSFKKLQKRSLKWVLYFLVSSLIAHSFIAYWTGAKNLLHMMQGSPSENWTYFIWVVSMTGLLLFNFGWFREQFCLIMCPYGKFQSTLMDSHTVTVMYDEKRGEPRKSPTTPKAVQGACVSCNRCVQVCPTGIDIRNGVQMECIGCTACMDACDEIMTKVHQPKGLIRYKATTQKKIQWFRPRVLTYFVLLVGAMVGLVLSLAFRSDLRVEVLRGKDTPYLVMKKENQDWVQNHFLLRLENEKSSPIQVQVQIPADVEIVLPENPVVLRPNEKKDLPLIVALPVTKFDAKGKMDLNLVFEHDQKQAKKTVPLLGPFRGEKK